MTQILEMMSKASKQWPPKFALATCLVLILFAASEFLTLDWFVVSDTSPQFASCVQSEPPNFPRGSGQTLASSLVLATSPTLDETLAIPGLVIHWANLTELAPKGLRTWIDTSESPDTRYFRYGIAPVKNLCVRPNGQLVVVGVSQAKFTRNLLEAEAAMIREWNLTYHLRNGVAFETETPEGALWISGNTTHVIPYQNVFHNFAERVWPHVSGLREPVKQFYMHEMHQWVDEAKGHMDRNTVLYQFAILARMSGPGTKLLQHTEDETRPLCFESFKLASTSIGGLIPRFGVENYAPSLERYRKTAFEYFQVPEPQVSVPPRPLRVMVYGRGDTKRRRVSNIAQVAEHLRSWTNPPLLVTLVDELLASGAYTQSLPETVSLMAQTDVLISVHGASTWATVFLPRRAAVVELTGPCGPPSWLHRITAPALALKHDAATNPWGKRVPSPVAGNTTECRTAYETPDFTIDIDRLDTALRKLSLPTGPRDRLPLYWLFDWKTKSY